MKVVTTHIGLAYEGPSIPTNSPLEKVVERDTEVTTKKEHSNCQKSVAHIEPLVVPISILEINVSRTQPKPTIPYPSRLIDQKLRKKATNQMEKFFQIFYDLHFDISFADALLLMPKFASTIKSLLTNKDKLFELAKKKLSLPELTPTRMTLELADRSITRPKGVDKDVFVKVGKFYFLTDFVVVDFEADLRVPLILGRSFLRTDRALIDVYGEEITLREPIVKSFSPTFTPFRESNFFLEEIKDFLNDESIPARIDNSFYDPEGVILFLEKLLNEDPFQLSLMDLKPAEETKEKSSIEEPLELELKELPSYLEYAFLEESNKLPVIIAKDLKDVEKEALIKVLKSHKREIAWKIFDIKVDLGASINLMPLSIWKKLSLPELTPTRMTLELADRSITRPKGVDKDVFVKVGKFYFPTDFVVVDFEADLRVPLILGRSFLRTDRALIDVYGEEIILRYNPKSSNPTLVYDPLISESDCCKEPIVKSSSPIFTPFGESDFFLEEIKDFINDESIRARIDNSFYDPEGHILFLEKLLNEDSFQLSLMDLKPAKETKAKSSIEEPLELELKELQSHLEEGIFLGHKISKSRIEVDRAKVDVIAKVPHSTTVKGVRSFLGHAGFCRRFIQDFSKIARPMTHLLEKETPFVFSKECIDAFDTLKKKLTEASILVVPDWNLPFELMCDANDFAIDAVL
nr:reverse transcriptase domain-containing protein [Tanacetum cinerariifolium]